MKSSPEQVSLSVKRSVLLKVAPLLLWLIAICLPIIVGRSIYLETFIQEKLRVSSMSRKNLMTRARELESKLTAEELIQQSLQLNGQPGRLLEIAPDLNVNSDDKLASFSTAIADLTGIKTAFIAGISKRPENCGLFLNLPEPCVKIATDMRHEIASLWPILSDASGKKGQLSEKEMAAADFYSKFMGIYEFISTDPWNLYASFSSRFREKLYFFTMVAPRTNAEADFFIIGFITGNQNLRQIMKLAREKFSDSEIKLSFGRSRSESFPVFTETPGKLKMTIQLPESFQMAFHLRKQKNFADRAIQLSLSTESYLNNQKKHIEWLNMTLLLFLFSTLLPAVGTCLEKIRVSANLARLIAASFVASMFLPVSALIWLAAADSRNSNESGSEELIRAVRLQIRQCETAFNLQGYRQQLLMLHLSKYISRLPEEEWGEFVDRFFFTTRESSMRAHLNNFYLYSAGLDQEFFRGRHPEEDFRRNELPRVLSGACRKLLLNIGVYNHLPPGRRQKILQSADFSAVVLEGLIQNSFYNNLFSRPAELNQATLFARRDPLSLFFIRSGNMVKGILCLARSFSLTAGIIDEINAFGSFKNKFMMNGHRIEIDFFLISNLSDDELHERIHPYAKVNPAIMDKSAATAFFRNSDSAVIDNLHQALPHILVTDTLLNRSVFAVAKISPLEKNSAKTSGFLFIGIIILTSCLALATGISRLILLPIPPFLAAFKEIEKNRYDWLLSLQTGDEFCLLASSINGMRVRLLERKKMLQLVSQTAAEAAKSGQVTLDKPRRQAAVILVSDIRNFTTISENNSAEEVVDMLNNYFSTMCPVIEEHGGFIDKLIGDAIQAVFIGSDLQQLTISACRAALAMRERLSAFNADRSNAGKFVINNGIGIASGIVTTGLTGSKKGKLEAAVLGEPLQKAAELESYSRFSDKTCIILSEDSYQLVAGMATTAIIRVSLPDAGVEKTARELHHI